MNNSFPDPSLQKASVWMAHITSEYLRDQGWQDTSERFPGIVTTGKQYAKKRFASQLDQQETFLDGLIFGLAALGHFADIEQLSGLCSTTADTVVEKE